MYCIYCKTPMRYTNFKEHSASVTYEWKCPRCGKSRQTKEEK